MFLDLVASFLSLDGQQWKRACQHGLPLHLRALTGTKSKSWVEIFAGDNVSELALGMASSLWTKSHFYWTLTALISFILLSLHLSGLRSYFQLSEFKRPHPIQTLVEEANARFDALPKSSTYDVAKAAASYRDRRGRHPPPYFEAWLRWAKKNNAPVAESFFDQIYEDLDPFWALPAAKIRADGGSWPNILTVRNGDVHQRTTLEVEWSNWLGKWQEMVQQIPRIYLPDVDLAFNADDEPHVFLPRMRKLELLTRSTETKHTKGPQDLEIAPTYASYPALPKKPTFEYFADAPSERSIWPLVRDACPSDSGAATAIQDIDFSTPANFSTDATTHMWEGFVSDWPAAKSPCSNLHLRNLNGYFVAPKTGSKLDTVHRLEDKLATRILFPVFSPAKIGGVNADILVPSPMYWSFDDSPYKGAPAWPKKADQIVWRGRGNGGRHNGTNFSRFHRQRFLSMLNGTQVDMTLRALESGLPVSVPYGDPPLLFNFPVPNATHHTIAAYEDGDLGGWIDRVSDAAFTNLACLIPPGTDMARYLAGESDVCDYIEPFYNVGEFRDMVTFFSSKYLPDVDGHGYSGRFLQFIRSNSVPIKATIWSEWHDARLVPWRHFVPMDNTMVDLYALMEYFIGYIPGPGINGRRITGHDATGRQIAGNGRDWAAKALRREDMVLYMWRLILEYARICDDKRDHMGFVEDLR